MIPNWGIIFFDFLRFVKHYKKRCNRCKCVGRLDNKGFFMQRFAAAKWGEPLLLLQSHLQVSSGSI
jgi:hypothetical protein